MNLITTKKAAAMLGLTTDALRYHERLGHVRAFRIDRGQGQYQRLFIEEDIQRFQQQRELARVAKTSKGETVEV